MTRPAPQPTSTLTIGTRVTIRKDVQFSNFMWDPELAALRDSSAVGTVDSYMPHDGRGLPYLVDFGAIGRVLFYAYELDVVAEAAAAS